MSWEISTFTRFIIIETLQKKLGTKLKKNLLVDYTIRQQFWGTHFQIADKIIIGEYVEKWYKKLKKRKFESSFYNLQRVEVHIAVLARKLDRVIMSWLLLWNTTDPMITSIIDPNLTVIIDRKTTGRTEIGVVKIILWSRRIGFT